MRIRLFCLVKLVIKTLVYSQQMESAGTLKTTDRHPWRHDLNPIEKSQGQLENKLEPEKKGFRG